MIEGFTKSDEVSPKILRIISNQKLNIVSKLQKLSARKVDDSSDRTLMAPLIGIFTDMMDKVPKGSLFPVKTKSETKGENNNRSSYSSPTGQAGGGNRGGKKKKGGKGGGGQVQNSQSSSSASSESAPASVKGKG